MARRNRMRSPATRPGAARWRGGACPVHAPGLLLAVAAYVSVVGVPSRALQADTLVRLARRCHSSSEPDAFTGHPPRRRSHGAHDAASTRGSDTSAPRPGPHGPVLAGDTIRAWRRSIW